MLVSACDLFAPRTSTLTNDMGLYIYTVFVIFISVTNCQYVNAKTLAESERNIGIAIGIMLAIVVCAVICLNISLKTCCKEKKVIKKDLDIEKSTNKNAYVPKNETVNAKEGSLRKSKDSQSDQLEGPNQKTPGNKVTNEPRDVPEDAPKEGEPNPIPIKPKVASSTSKSQKGEQSLEGSSSIRSTPSPSASNSLPVRSEEQANPPPLTKQVPLNKEKPVKSFSQSPPSSGSSSNSPTSNRSLVSEPRSVASQKSGSSSPDQGSN